jgi:glycosyltransferase involved in cell wall biosynthesis
MLLADAFGSRLAGYFSYSRPYPRLVNPRRFDVAPELLEEAGRVSPVLDWANPMSWRETARRIMDSGASVLIAPWWTAFWALPLRGVFRETTRSESGFHNILLCHHVFDHESAAWKKALTWKAFSAADAVIAQAQADRATISARFPEKPIVILPHPVEARPLADREASRQKWGVQGPLVLFLGLIRPYKGIDVLFDAAPRIVDETGASIAVVGEVFPDSRAEILRLMQRPIAPSVRLVDRYVTESEMDEWLAACDVVVCPYRKNSGSGIAARAIAALRPVVASDLSGFMPFVTERTGALIPEDRSDRLAEEVIRVLRNGIDHYGLALSELVQRHSWAGYADAVEAFASKIRLSRDDRPDVRSQP